MPDKQKSINSNNLDALPKVLVMFVNHISNLARFYWSVSFASQYIMKEEGPILAPIGIVNECVYI